MMIRVYCILSILGFCVGCSTEKERVIDREKSKVQAHLNLFTQFLTFDVRDDSIVGIDIDGNGEISVLIRGNHVNVPVDTSALSDITIALLEDYKTKLNSLDYSRLWLAKGYVQVMPRFGLFSRNCFHIKIYREASGASISGGHKLAEGIYLYFQGCAAISFDYTPLNPLPLSGPSDCLMFCQI